MKKEINMKNKKGFSLIELLIVVAIIFICIVIIIPRFTTLKERKDCNICQSYEKRLDLLQKQYDKHVDKHVDVKHNKK